MEELSRIIQFLLWTWTRRWKVLIMETVAEGGDLLDVDTAEEVAVEIVRGGK